LFPFNFTFRILIISLLNFSDLSAQLESLQLAAEYAAGFVNARGVVPIVGLYDIPNRVSEVTLHGVRHGAATALAAAQAHYGHNLRLLPHGFLGAVHLGNHKRLTEDFLSAADSVAFNTLADDIVGKVSSDP